MISEVDLIHRRWELISETTKVLDVASCPDERKMLALLLEDKRLRLWWHTEGQYEKVYLPSIKDLHDRCYAHCSELVSNIKVGSIGNEQDL